MQQRQIVVATLKMKIKGNDEEIDKFNIKTDVKFVDSMFNHLDR